MNFLCPLCGEPTGTAPGGKDSNGYYIVRTHSMKPPVSFTLPDRMIVIECPISGAFAREAV